MERASASEVSAVSQVQKPATPPWCGRRLQGTVMVFSFNPHLPRTGI